MQDVPDLILLDLHLPDLHGEQVLKELRAEPVTAAIPVVVLSADATPGVIRRLLASGAIAYLTKPLDLAELGKLIGSFASPAQESAGSYRDAKDTSMNSASGAGAPEAPPPRPQRAAP